MRKFYIFTLAVLVSVIGFANTGSCDFSTNDAGKAGAQFLKIGVGARAIGMGEAYGAVSNDANAVYWNPAGLNQIEGKEVSFMHAMWLEAISYENLVYVQPTKCCVIGGAINYLAVGKIDKYDNSGTPLNETFSPSDMAVTLSFAKKYHNVPVGMNIKYISSTIDDKSPSAFAIDLGVMKKFKNDKLTVGIVLQNLGTKMKFITQEDPLPMNIKIASAYNLMLKNKPMLIALDLNAPIDNELRVNFGVEYKLGIGETMSLSPRIGYKTNTKGLTGTAGLSIGFGFILDSYGIDYAWVPFGDLGDTHRVSLNIKF